MTSVSARQKSSVERRKAILEATFHLVAQGGITNLTTSAVSREAGIAAGTLFLYFDTKETLINALYVDLVRRRQVGITAGLDAATSEDELEAFWYAWTRWYLDEPEISRVIQQCEASYVLTPESLAVRDELDEATRTHYFPGSADVLAVPLRRQVIYALLTGPTLVLAQLRDKGEIEITDELLDETYRCVRRALED